MYKYLFDHKYGGIIYICERDGSSIGTYAHDPLLVNSSKIKTSELNSFAVYVLLEYLEDRRIGKIKENCTDRIHDVIICHLRIRPVIVMSEVLIVML